MAVEAVALPFKEAIAYWKSKTPVTDEAFNAMSGAAKSRAFAVSGLSRMDHVNSVHAAMLAAIENGETLKDFKTRIADVIEAQGWKGFRLETIFRTNAQSAYMAGRYAQMTAAKKARPYWKYSSVNDRRTRPEHLHLNGKIFPADHEFWDTWYPPNGYRCRCTVVSLSARQVEKRGLTVETEDPTGDLFEPVDPISGVRMPARPLMPDPGWSKNAGKDWLSGLTPSEMDGEVKQLPSGILCRDGKGLFAADGCKPALSEIDSRHILPVAKGDILPAGLSDEAYVKAFLAEFGVAKIGQSKVHKLPGGIPVVISKDFFVSEKKSGGWKVKKAGRERFVKLLARTIRDPFEIWQAPVEVKGKIRQSLNLIRLFEGEKGKIGGFVVFSLIGKKWLSTTAYPAKLGKPEVVMLDYLEGKRSGVLLYREALE